MLKMMTSLAFGIALCATSVVYADDVVQEHKKALGSKEAIEKIKSIRRTGEIQFKGMFDGKGAFEEYAVLGKKSGQKIKGDEFESTRVWDGEKGWASNTYMPVAEIEGNQLDQMKGVASINSFLGMAVDMPPEKLVAGADADFGGVACKTYSPEKDMTIYIGKEDHLFHGMTAKAPDPGSGQDVTVKTTYSDFKEYEGVKFPNSVVTVIGDDDLTITTKFDKTEINPELGDALFAKPK